MPGGGGAGGASARPEVADWISRSRLNASAAAERGLDPTDPCRHQLRALMREVAVLAAA